MLAHITVIQEPKLKMYRLGIYYRVYRYQAYRPINFSWIYAVLFTRILLVVSYRLIGKEMKL